MLMVGTQDLGLDFKKQDEVFLSFLSSKVRPSFMKNEDDFGQKLDI